MKTVSNFFTKVDFVGLQLKPTLNGSNRVKSVLGGILSLIVSVCIVFGFSYFGLSMIRKDKPIMNNIQRKTGAADIPLNEIPYMLVAYNNLGQMIHTKAEFKRSIQIEVLYEIIRPPGPGEETYSYRRYIGQVEDCTKKHIQPKIWEELNGLGYEPGEALCLNTDTLTDHFGNKFEEEPILRNGAADINSNFLTFKIKYCDEVADPGCREYIDSIGRVNMGMYYSNYFVDQSDFHDPVKPDSKASLYQISNKLVQSISIVTQINDIVTDKSLFLSETSTERFYSFYSLANNVGSFDSKSRVALQFVLSVNTILNINERRYLKVPEMLANMGGFLKAAFLIANVLSYTYSQYICFVTIGQIEFKYTAKPMVSNNFVESNISNNSKIHVKSIKIDKKISKGNKTANLTFFQFVKSLFSRNKDINESKDKRLKYLELNYLIQCLLFVEDLKRKSDNNV